LEDGREVSFEIRQYRVLAREKTPLLPESDLEYPPLPIYGENI
jgi:hypothetical protein